MQQIYGYTYQPYGATEGCAEYKLHKYSMKVSVTDATCHSFFIFIHPVVVMSFTKLFDQALYFASYKQ
jgi:hypothetical protein